ncbi:MAG: hypothetical protein AAFQ83_17750 [Bacteroidota bacterium]
MKHTPHLKITLLALATLAMTTFSCQRATLENHTERLLQLQGMWELSAQWAGDLDDVTLPVPSHITFDSEGVFSASMQGETLYSGTYVLGYEYAAEAEENYNGNLITVRLESGEELKFVICLLTNNKLHTIYNDPVTDTPVTLDGEKM